MIRIEAFANETVVVLGLGRSGMAAARALVASGARVAAWDDAVPARETALAAGVPLADPAALDWGRVAALVISPGIPHTHPRPHPAAAAARAAGVPIIGDIELLARARPRARFLGVTGTNGKSTTTALLGHLLAAAGRAIQVGGNLGLPALEMGPLDDDGVYVLEMSSYQLELTPAMPFDVAVLLNISPDHLGRHGGMEGYVAAKRSILRKPGAAAVVGIDDPTARALAEERAPAGRLTRVSALERVPGGVHAVDGRLIDETDGAPVTVLDLRGVATLPGAHNWQNAAAAYAAARAVGLSRAEIAAAMRTYPGLAHRQERVAEIDGVLFVNDSKATNADAAARALTCNRDIHWIIGGRAKEGGLAGVEPHLDRVRRAYLIGEAADEFGRWLEGRLPALPCGTLEVAVARAFAAARAEGGMVLLSPACASFDQFRDFEARGEAFKALVHALPRAATGGRP